MINFWEWGDVVDLIVDAVVDWSARGLVVLVSCLTRLGGLLVGICLFIVWEVVKWLGVSLMIVSEVW